MPRHDLGPGVHVGRRHLVANLLGDQAAERHLLLARVGLGLVQKRDNHRLGARLVNVHLERVADVGGEPFGVPRVDEVIARADDDLAEPGQLADEVGPLLDDLLPADRLDHHPAAELHGDAQAVAPDQPLAVVGDRVGGLLQVERAVDLMREPFQLVPEPLLRHHLSHLPVLEVRPRQVAEIADEPERALLRRRATVRVHHDFDQADHLLVHHEWSKDQRERRRIPRVRDPLDRRAGGDDLRLRGLDHAPQKRIVRLRPGPAVHQSGEPELQLMLEFETAFAVEQPEYPPRRRHGGHGAIEEFDVKFGGLDVRFGEVRDLGHQLTDLVLCLLEQTGINRFFRHGGSGCWAPGSESPGQFRRRDRLSRFRDAPLRRGRHNDNRTAEPPRFPGIFLPARRHLPLPPPPLPFPSITPPWFACQEPGRGIKFT